MKVLNAYDVKDQKIIPYNKLPKSIICFSHLRWDFVFQRPQHLLTRFSRMFNIFFIEEPVFHDEGKNYYSFSSRGENISVIVPHVINGLSAARVKAAQIELFDQFMESRATEEHLFWYYTPMALEFTRKHTAEVTVFDCMDELSAFKFAPEELKTLEKELLQKADIVFTGGHSIYEAKKDKHPNIFPFPSSIEKEHFSQARAIEPKDDKVRLGFYGVIDERFDIGLIRDVACAKPEWDIELIGPVVKIDPEMLPNNSNIHYMGPKTYNELPGYLANWSIALIPFLLNESTRFISPTKTPEYLAGGKPVISTPIRDVINPYGKNKLVHIISNASDLIAAAEKELAQKQKDKWLKKVDGFLALNSWDKTCLEMLSLIEQTMNDRSYSIAQ